MAAQPLGQVHDHPAQAGHDGGFGAGHLGGRRHEVLLVVPARDERPAGGTAHAHDLGGAVAAGGQRGPGGVVEVPQLAVRRHQRRLGGRMVGHRGERAGLGGQGPADGGGHHRRGHRATALAGERSCPKELGQPVRGEERDADQAGSGARHGALAAGRQLAAHRHAHLVGRDDHRDRRQHLARLRLGDLGAQRRRGLGAVAQPSAADRTHRADGTQPG
ncbi:MAG: hypothetical protein KF703_03890 [Actinobacteria bacterium]|nr:hypothetical protein [Actinomycetota bacterium]